MGSKRPSSLKASGGSSKKHRTAHRPKAKEDDGGLDDVAPYEMKPRGGEQWLEATKRLAALPVITEGGSWQPLHSVNPGRAEELSDKEDSIAVMRSKRDAKKAAKKAARTTNSTKSQEQFRSPHINGQQRMDLRKKYPTFVSSSDSMMDIIAEINQKIVMDPEANLYWIELLILGLRQLASEVESAKSSGEAELNAKAKVYLLLFLSVGAILRNVLPAYVMQVQNEAEQDGPKLSKEVRKLKAYEAHLLEVYTRFLHRHLFLMLRDKWWSANKGSILSEKFVAFVAELMFSARFTNNRESLFEEVIDYILRSTDSEMTAPVYKALSDIFREDTTLDFSTKLTALVMKRLTSLKSSKTKSTVGAIELLRSLRSLEIGRKEGSAEAELRRRGIREGIDLSKSRDADERAMDAEFMKGLSSGLVYGDFKRFRSNKNQILTHLMTFYARVLRGPHLYPLPIVFETLRGLTEHAQYVNIELMKEIFIELRKMCEEHMQKSINAGPLILASVAASLALIKASPNSMRLEEDVTWLGSAVIRGLMDSLPHALSASSVPSDTSPEAITFDSIVEILKRALEHKHIWGVSSTQISYLSAPTQALDLLVCLSGTRPHLEGTVAAEAQSMIGMLIGAFPGLKSALDEDGVVVSSLAPSRTIAWCIHLSERSSIKV